MTDPLAITIHTVGHCQECGAIVHDEAKHFEWHVDQLPEQVPDPWEEALAAAPKPGSSAWNYLLVTAIRNVSSALIFSSAPEDSPRYPGSDQPATLLAASKVRAMAPEGTKWDNTPPHVPDADARSVLRAVLRALLAADARRETRTDPTVNLQNAEAYLHGLWLAAQEVG